MKDKIVYFKDLSGSLKTLVIFGWIFVGINVIVFLFEFIAGIIGGI